MLISAVNNPYYVLNIVVNIMWKTRNPQLPIETARYYSYSTLIDLTNVESLATSLH
ncbi:Uncharacterised protein [Sphingobacterium thalpophilum]|uniref:Uncharacterized protein n=1 Tax=Sphingobacterium thalpophilum TaxID=259 RepID=A0A4U9VG23_9SPHI|nr:Uncharacterised protein [Sphingobacterium thalpophilum]